jgi:hypothetical protein
MQMTGKLRGRCGEGVGKLGARTTSSGISSQLMYHLLSWLRSG